MGKWHLYDSITPEIPVVTGEYVYMVEFCDVLKIGYTKHPRVRFQALNGACKKLHGTGIGRIALSEDQDSCMISARPIERMLHEHFSQYRIPNSEMFNISFEEALASAPNCLYEAGDKTPIIPQPEQVTGCARCTELEVELENELRKVQKLERQLDVAKRMIVAALGVDWRELFEEEKEI